MTLRRYLAIVDEAASVVGTVHVDWVRVRYGAGAEGAHRDAVERGFLADELDGMVTLLAAGRSYMTVTNALDDDDWAFAPKRITATMERLCEIVRAHACPLGWSDAEAVAAAYGYGGAGAILVAKTMGMLNVLDDGRRLQLATSAKENAEGDGLISDSA